MDERGPSTWRGLWYLITGGAGCLAIGAWFLLTRDLAELGVSVIWTRGAAVAIGLFFIAGAAVDDAQKLVRARIDQGRTLRSHEALPEAGQISVAHDERQGTLSLPEGD